MKAPVVDLSLCSRCMACVEVLPEVFRENDAGFVEVVDLSRYPRKEVNEVIKYCPEDCIYWEER